jgi:hypothetical protein
MPIRRTQGPTIHTWDGDPEVRQHAFGGYGKETCGVSGGLAGGAGRPRGTLAVEGKQCSCYCHWDEWSVHLDTGPLALDPVEEVHTAMAQPDLAVPVMSSTISAVIGREK